MLKRIIQYKQEAVHTGFANSMHINTSLKNGIKRVKSLVSYN